MHRLLWEWAVTQTIPLYFPTEACPDWVLSQQACVLLSHMDRGIQGRRPGWRGGGGGDGQSRDEIRMETKSCQTSGCSVPMVIKEFPPLLWCKWLVSQTTRAEKPQRQTCGKNSVSGATCPNLDHLSFFFHYRWRCCRCWCITVLFLLSS